MPSDMQGFPGQPVLTPYLFAAESGPLQSAGASPRLYANLAAESFFRGNADGIARGLGALDLQFARDNPTSVASGPASCLVGSQESKASARGSSVFGGATNYSQGTYSVIVGGKINTVNGNSAFATGQRNTVNGAFAFGIGQRNLAPKQGQFAMGAANIASTAGAAQQSLYEMANVTTDATTTKLWLDGDVGTLPLTIATNQAFAFHILVVAATILAADSAMFLINGGIANNNGTVALVGVPTSALIGNTAGAALWTAVAAADNTAKALLINVTGAAATTIRWVAAVQCAEVTF
jgi:hypothetical protein